MKTQHIQHLYRRIGFGILPSPLDALAHKSKKDVIDMLFKASKRSTPLEIDTSEINAIVKQKLSTSNTLDTETKRKIRQLSRKKQQAFNVAWLERLTTSNALLREKMTLFWANHFVCEDNNIVYIQHFNNTLRTHALGNFKDFVNAISKEAAMTRYLNNKQNRKLKPNENFARELMELFTLGVGHYTENDIKESAKAFTGYNHDVHGAFKFRARQHDDGFKTFLGETGRFSGEDIIAIILKQKACAHFVCSKIYRYFVNDVPNATHIDQMATVFYKDYNIEKLMRFVLLSDWFYDKQHIGTKIKSPIEFLAGLKTLVPTTFKKNRQVIIIQRMLGQTLLDPPNVAGWKGGRSWIDSNTIILRLRLPSLILNNAYISTIGADETDAIAALKKQRFNTKGKRFNTTTNWAYFETHFKNIPLEAMAPHLLACDITPETKAYLSSLKKTSKQDYCIQLMSLPEYQMC